MKTCKNCGASINDDARFCTNCGADTFAGADEERTAVLSEASAEPATDNTVSGGEYYQPEAAQTESAEQSGAYYQPAGSNAESDTSSAYTYAVPTDQVPVGKGKKSKGRIGAIILSVVIIIGVILFKIGVRVLDYVDFGDVASSLSTISEGYETSTAYINSSINLTIDSSKGGMDLFSAEEKEYYLGDSANSYETYLYDFDTNESIRVLMATGNLADSTVNMKKKVAELVEDIYEDDTACKISDVYERKIAGNTYTCVDVSETVNDPDYGTYYIEQSLCFIRSSTVFLEIVIDAYPEETGRHPQDLIDQYFVEMFNILLK